MSVNEVAMTVSTVFALIGLSALHHRAKQRRMQKQLGHIIVDAEGFAYYRNDRLIEAVKWRDIESIHFARVEESDLWAEDEGSWLEEQWLVHVKGNMFPVTIQNTPLVQRTFIKACSRFLPGFSIDSTIWSRAESIGTWKVYEAKQTITPNDS
jgi:hypothetical protein